MKTKIKNAKTKIIKFFTKKRTIKNKKVRYIFTVLFLLLVDIYIINNIYHQANSQWRVTITAIAEAEDNNGSASASTYSDGELPPEGKNTAKPSGVASSEEVIEKIKQTFPEETKTMIAIAIAESRLIPTAEHTNNNGTKDCGIFQVNEIHGYDCEKLKNVDFNLKVAREVYEKQGKTAWATYNYAIKYNKPI